MKSPEKLYHFSGPVDRERIQRYGLSTAFLERSDDDIVLSAVPRVTLLDCWEVSTLGLDVSRDGADKTGLTWRYGSSIRPHRLRLWTSAGVGEALTESPSFLMFAGKRNEPDKPWKNLYNSAFQVRMCDKVPVVVEVTRLETPEPGCYFAFHDKLQEALHFVYPTEAMVRMCDPGGFEPAIARGHGNVIAVSITEYVAVN